jgi:CO/xanthine dehydrogenase Mo-binding subunit
MTAEAADQIERIGQRLRIAPDGTVIVLAGKVEIGQGVLTAFAQIAADELDVPLGRVRVVPADTAIGPNDGSTSGSRSIAESGEDLRRVAARARELLLERAAARLGAPAASLTIAGGVVRTAAGASVTYAELVDDALLAAAPAGATPKAPAARRVIGTRVPRLDLPNKILGKPAYVQDLTLPGMTHGRVVRSPIQSARLVSVDLEELRRLPGVIAVVRDGSFLGIVAGSEIQALRAQARARRIAVWEPGSGLPPADPHYLLGEATADAVHGEKADSAALARASRSYTAEFSRPFIAHGALGPSCAVAQVEDGRTTVWTHAQGVFPLRHELALVLGAPLTAIRVIHMEGAGCYGHNGADDAALDAVLLARAVPGRPVRVQWMRDDEFAWEPYGPASVVRISASLDDAGRIVDWTHEIWGNGHGNRPGPRSDARSASLLAAQHLATPFAPTVSPQARNLVSGELRNAAPAYTFPNQRIIDHYVARSPLRTSALRSLGAHANVFAIESAMDDLAAAARQGPLAFRLAHLDDPRAREVLEAATAKAGWRDDETSDGSRARGIAYARYKNLAAYFAVVAEVALDTEIHVTRVWAAIDAGMAVSPDGVINQTEGGIVQATSWTLMERVRHDEMQATSLGWDTYPTIRFSQIPDIDVTLIDRPDQPPLGAGEAYAGPVSAAIGNAIRRATGVRLRDLPLTPDRLLKA